VDTTVDRILERLLELLCRGVPFARCPSLVLAGRSTQRGHHDPRRRTPGRSKLLFRLMDLDDSVGIKSSFELVPESRYSLPETFLEEIRTRGFEINVPISTTTAVSFPATPLPAAGRSDQQLR